MIIRPAVEADIPEIVSICETVLAGELAKLEIAHERKHLDAYFRSFVGKEGKAIFVCDLNGAVGGFILASAFPSAVSGETMAMKNAWIMLPKYRGHGTALLRQAEKWAAAKGATIFYATLPNPMPHVAMQRLGYKPHETIYKRKLVPQAQPKKEAT